MRPVSKKKKAQPPPQDQFINIRQGDPRTDPEQLVGDVSYTANFSTRIGVNKWRTYDGRLIHPTHVSAENVEMFRKSRMTGHAVRSIVKGILIDAPHIINACTEVKLTEALLQISPEARRIGKAALLLMFSQAPVNRVLQAFSCILNHDGDLERVRNTEWWRWRDRTKEGGDPTLRLDRHRYTHWARRAGISRAMAAKANDTRSSMRPCKRRHVPTIDVFETDNKGYSTVPLTAGKVSQIHEAQ